MRQNISSFNCTVEIQRSKNGMGIVEGVTETYSSTFYTFYYSFPGLVEYKIKNVFQESVTHGSIDYP